MSRVISCALAAGITFGITPPLHAQQGPPPADAVPPSPAQQYAVSDGGVDMRTGQYTYSMTDLSMGGEGGMTLVRDQGSNDHRMWQPMGQFSHNWHLHIAYKPAQSNALGIFTIQGSRGQQFTTGSNTNSFINYAANLRTSLEAFPTGPGHFDRYFVYTAADGTKVTFRPQVPISDRANRGSQTGAASFFAESIEEPDGTTYTLAYDPPTSTTPAFLRRVTSNRGYVLIFEWVTNPVDKFVSKACMFNAAVETVPTSNSCSGASHSVSYSYKSNGTMTNAIHPDGRNYAYNSNYSQAAWDAAVANWPNTNYTWTETFTHPGETSPYLTNTIYRNLFVQNTQSQNFSVGPDYTYSWNVTEHNEQSFEVAGGTMTRSDGASKTIEYQEMTRAGYQYGDSYVISEGPDRIVDELGRELTSNYCVTITVGGQQVFPLVTGCAAVSARYWKFPEGNQTD